MPYTYHNFDPWAKAGQNIAAGMVAVNEAKNRRMIAEANLMQNQAQFDAKLEFERPAQDALVEQRKASARKSTLDGDYTQAQLDAAKNLGPVLAKSFKKNPETGVWETDDTGIEALITAAMTTKSPGTQVSAALRGVNDSAEKSLNRQNQAEMNEADNAAAMERAKLPSRSSGTPKAVSVQMEIWKDRIVRANAAIKKLEEFPIKPGSKAEAQREDWLEEIAMYEDRINKAVAAATQNSQLTPAAGGDKPPITGGTNAVVRRYNPATRRLE